MYNWFAAFWRFVERQRERQLYADAHARLYAMGGRYQASFYGTLKTPYDGKHDQARIEVVTHVEPDADFVTRLYDLMSRFTPEKEYTLFVVTGKGLKEIICV